MLFEVYWNYAMALNPAGRREMRTGIMGDGEKAVPCQIRDWKAEGRS